MAYTDPNIGITRDKFGNEVRNPTGTDPHSHTNYWSWVIGLAIAAVAGFALISAMNTPDDTLSNRTAPESSTAQPAPPLVQTPPAAVTPGGQSPNNPPPATP